MKKIISLLILFTIINNTFSQTLIKDTLLARTYLIKADKFQKESEFDSSSEYLIKAGNIYSTHNLNEAFLECELKRVDLFIYKRELNKALDILSQGKQKAISTSGENSDIYADFCEKTGFVYLYAKKYSEARNQQIKALGIRKKIHGINHIKITDSYNNLALLYAKTGEYYKSLKLYEKALQIRKQILPEDDLRIASSLLNTGRAYMKTKNPDFALKCFSEAMTIKKKKLNAYNQELATLYAETGSTFRLSGNYEKASENYEKALQITVRNLGENSKETASLFATAAKMLDYTGKYGKALEYNEKALGIFKNIFGEESSAVAKILINTGEVYLKMNNFKAAVENFNQSLEISKKQYETWNLKVAEQYTKIGLILSENSKNNAAINYFNNALIVQQNVLKSDNHLEVAESYKNIGNAYENDGEYYPAIENYDKSLEIRLKLSGNKNPKTAELFFLKASAYKIKKDYFSELKFLQKALISNVENFDLQDISQNPDLNNNFNLYYDQKLLLETLIEKTYAFKNLFLRSNNPDFLKKAADAYGAADLIIERIRKTALLSKDKKYLDDKISEVYEKATALCMLIYNKTNENNYLNKAFFYAEKNKAYILCSLPQATKFAGISDSILNIETNLLSDLAYLRKKISENPSDKDKSKLIGLYKKYQSFIYESKQNCPKYNKLKYKDYSVTVRKIQNFINDSTVVLSYFAPKSANYIYVFSIGKRDTHYHIIKDPNFNNKLKNYRKHLFSQNEASVKAYTEEAFALYNELIPDFVKNKTSIKHLIVIPGGTIGMIPFESLLTEEYFGNSMNFTDYPFLIKRYSVTYSESGDFLQNTSSEIPDSLYTDDWVGIAPVFDKPDIKMISKETYNNLKKTQQTFQTNSETRLLSGNHISYLTESEKEVTDINNEFEISEKSPEIDLRDEADEEFIQLIDAEEFKYIHIASHAFINSENPSLSGILFAHNSDDDENDGVVYMNEIYNLNLNPELLVLSTCETGYGKYDRNESIAGFSKAIFYTGTKNIILSLWEVSGEPRAELMLNFYKNILNTNDLNNQYGNSLRITKLKLIEDGSYAHPFYWSPFILIEK